MNRSSQSMQLIDTHTHLYLPEFDNDRAEVIARAVDLGVEKFFLPNIDRSSVQRILEMKEKYPESCYPMMGLHPNAVGSGYMSELEEVRKQLDTNIYYAVGEIGIDLYRNKKYEKEQVMVFRTQVQLGLEFDLPIVIHSRDSFDLIVEILNDYNDPRLRGVFHSFTGNRNQAETVISLGFKLGIGGIVTFKNSPLPVVVRDIDLAHIVLETDAPYLARVPKRGKRNESSYIVYINEKIAELHQKETAEVARITTINAQKLFNLISNT